MTSSNWDPGYIATGNNERYRLTASLPLTPIEPPAAKEIRVGPSGYKYVSQAPQYVGQIVVVLPPQTNTPTMMCVVSLNGELVWKQVLFGTFRDAKNSRDYDAQFGNKKVSGRRRTI